MPPEQHDDKINPAVIVIIVVVIGMIAAGPIYYLTQLDEKIGLEMDYERTLKLQSTIFNIENHFSYNYSLPTSIDQLSIHIINDARDPETQNFFEYRKIDELNYELCADFHANHNDKKPSEKYFNPTKIEYTKGHYCFSQKIPDYASSKSNVTNSKSALEYNATSTIPLTKDEYTVSFQRNGFCGNLINTSNASLISDYIGKILIDNAAAPKCELKGKNFTPDSSSYRVYGCSNFKENTIPKSTSTIAFKCKTPTQ